MPLSDELAFEAVEQVRIHGSIAAAARANKLARKTFSDRYYIGVQRTAALGVEEPYLIRGTSTLFDSEGKAKLQWVKTKEDDKRRLAMMLAAIDKRCENIKPRPPIKFDAKITPDYDLCNLVTLTDCHVGALAWDREAGEDWDLAIAKEELTRSFVGMIHAMPAGVG